MYTRSAKRLAPRQSAAAASKTGGFRPMDIRYSCNQLDFKRYTTEEVRNEFLITDLYKADEMVAVYSHVDRMVTLGCMPVNEVVSIDKGIDIWANFGTHYFLERREIGIFNIGDGAGIDVGDGRKRRDRLLLVSFDFLRLLVEIQTDDAPGNDQQDEQCRNNKQCIAKLVRTGGVSARMLRH